MAGFIVWALFLIQNCFADETFRTYHFTFQTKPVLSRKQESLSCRKPLIILCALDCTFTPNCGEFSNGGWKLWVGVRSDSRNVVAADEEASSAKKKIEIRGQFSIRPKTNSSDKKRNKTKRRTEQGGQNHESCQMLPFLDHGEWVVRRKPGRHAGFARCEPNFFFCGHQREITCRLEIGTWSKPGGSCHQNIWKNLNAKGLTTIIIPCNMNHKITVTGNYTGRDLTVQHRFHPKSKFKDLKTGASFTLVIGTHNDELEYTLHGERTVYRFAVKGFLSGVDKLTINSPVGVKTIHIQVKGKEENN